MEAGTRDSAQHVSTAEEETLKRNTDCVYFLASPLTCKKGSECEYRHSEAARINPRDCWYWVNGNCLNPKCAFRHPPLDGLIGTPGTPSVGVSVPPSQSVPLKMPPSHTPSYSSGKPAVPCYYFQKGLCLKGDRCAFLHGGQPLTNPPPQQQETKTVTNISEPLNPKRTYGSLDKSNQQQTTGENVRKSTEVPPQPKPVMKPETSPSEVSIMRRNILPPFTSVDERQKHMITNASPNASGNSVPRPQRSLQAQAFDDRVLQDGKDADEFLRESSPGFDVLVDDELRDPDYYHAEDEYRRTASHEGRRLNSLNEFDYDHPVNYAPVAKFDREAYDDPHGFDSYGKVQDQYAREQRRVLSDWTERPSMLEKRGFSRVEKPDKIDESDLRQRLSKQRRVNGSRSAVSPGRRGDVHRRDDHDRHIHDQRNRGYSSRDSHHIPHESSRSNRLQGRLSLPRRSSPDRSRNDSRLERDIDGGMSRSRLSPGRPPTSFLQGRQEGRLRRPGQDDLREARNIRGTRSDEVDGDTSSFAGPKSLAELKGAKISESTEARVVKARQVSQPKEQKNLRLGPLMGYQESEGLTHFEGPKPLSEILKRKRGAETASSRNGTASEYGQLDSPEESGEIIAGSPRISAEKETVQTSEAEKEANDNTQGMKEDQRSLDAGPDIATEDNEEGQITTKGYDVVPRGEISYAQKGTELESEDGMMVDDAMEDQEDQELENYDQRDGEYDYEPTDGGDDENVDEEEYFDDEDGDDFAKKIGVMFS